MVCNYYCCNGVIIVDGVCVSVLCRCSRKDYSQGAPPGPDSGLMLRRTPKPFGSVREKSLRVSPSAV